MSDKTQKDSLENSNYDAIEKRINKEKEKHKKAEEYVEKILCRLTLATKIWLGIFFLLSIFQLYKSIGCERDSAIIACLTVNEIGDFLAGFFAPLAFIWLAATVFIQSREFRAQREELTLTRIELELSRGVAEEAKEATKSQALEAKRSGDFFEQQTSILREEHDIRLQSEATKQFDVVCQERNRESELITYLTIRTKDGNNGHVLSHIYKNTDFLAINREIQNCIFFHGRREDGAGQEKVISIEETIIRLKQLSDTLKDTASIGHNMSISDKTDRKIAKLDSQVHALDNLIITIEDNRSKYNF